MKVKVLDCLENFYKMLGKRVEAKIQARDEKGKLSTSFTTVSGLCTFVGKNEILSWPFQITIDRCPFQIRSLQDVKILG